MQFASVQESFTLVGATALYTWGSGGMINSTRPHSLIGGFIRDTQGTDHGVDVITEGTYRSLTVKNTSSRPYSMFYKSSFPLGALYLYPTPTEAEVFYITSVKPFEEVGSFAILGDSLQFPAEYEEPVVYNLAIRIAPEYGVTVPAEIASVAEVSLRNLIALNSSNALDSIGCLVPASPPLGPRYSINSDTYR